MLPHDENDIHKITKALQRAKRNIGCGFAAVGGLTFGCVGFFVGASLGGRSPDNAGAGGLGASVGVVVGLIIGDLLAGAVAAALDWRAQVLITQEKIRESLETKSEK
jgi:hypothetical protein